MVNPEPPRFSNLTEITFSDILASHILAEWMEPAWDGGAPILEYEIEVFGVCPGPEPKSFATGVPLPLNFVCAFFFVCVLLSVFFLLMRLRHLLGCRL